MAARLLREPAPLARIESRPWHRWLVVGLVCVGAFVGQLDATIVQLALPTLSRTFGVRLQEVSWVALAYLLAFASFLPIFGRLCEIVGRKSLYLIGYAIFVVASFLCGVSGSFGQLIAFRVLQGIGGALLGANSISLLVAAIPTELRGRALGYFAAAQAIGMSAGPALGGILLDTLGWRWLFWVTVPFGAAAAVVGWLALPRTPPSATRKSFDWNGALLIGPALVVLVGALNHASSWGLFSLPTLGSVLITVVLLVLLVRRERQTASPLIDPRLLRSPAFREGALATICAYALLYSSFFLMSFAEEHGYHESPVESGFRLAIIPVAIGVSAPFSHRLSARLGGRRIGVVAMLVCLIGVVIIMIAVGREHHRALDTVAFVLLGVGLGLFIAPNNAATIAAVPAELAGSAGSLLNLMRVLGTSLGVAAAATTLAWRLKLAGGTGDWTATRATSLLSATRHSLPVLAALAIGAGVTSYLGVRAANRPRRADRADGTGRAG